MKCEDIIEWNDDSLDYVPNGMEKGVFSLVCQWSDELHIHDMSSIMIRLNAPVFFGKHLIYGEDKKVKPTDSSLKDWIEATEKLKSITKELQVRQAAAEKLLAEMREYSRSLQSCVPLPYDMEMFELGWIYQNKFLRHVNHWSVSRIPDSIEPKAKAGYEKCRKLFEYLTEGLVTHNFSIITCDDGSKASFEFNVETVPGKIEIYFPLIVKRFGNSKAAIEYTDKLMAMGLGWRMHDIIPIIDKFWCKTYSLEEIKESLKSYVDNAEWRNNLHKTFVKRDENGEEILLDKIPDWYEANIQKIIAKSAIEKDWTKNNCGD